MSVRADTPSAGEEVTPPLADPRCPFCARQMLSQVLTETPHFYVLVDHAPLVEGHILTIPKAHYACYGAIPGAYDAELLTLKGVVRDFLAATYREPTFFEHGVFHQTVYHAHLHAFPLGTRGLDLATLAGGAGTPVAAQDDIRRWYAQRGDYFYIEAPRDDGGARALFPPDEMAYRTALMTLLARSEAVHGFVSPLERRATAGPKMRRVADRWAAWSADDARGERASGE